MIIHCLSLTSLGRARNSTKMHVSLTGPGNQDLPGDGLGSSVARHESTWEWMVGQGGDGAENRYTAREGGIQGLFQGVGHGVAFLSFVG